MLVTESCGYAVHVKEASAGLVSPMPYDQNDFNAKWLEMRKALAVGSTDKPNWARRGLAYTKKIMQANDGSAEAEILIRLAEAKKADGGA